MRDGEPKPSHLTPEASPSRRELPISALLRPDSFSVKNGKLAHRATQHRHWQSIHQHFPRGRRRWGAGSQIARNDFGKRKRREPLS